MTHGDVNDMVIDFLDKFYPNMLSDDELVEGLIFFVWCMMQEAVLEEKGNAYARAMARSCQ